MTFELEGMGVCLWVAALCVRDLFRARAALLGARGMRCEGEMALGVLR